MLQLASTDRVGIDGEAVVAAGDEREADQSELAAVGVRSVHVADLVAHRRVALHPEAVSLSTQTRTRHAPRISCDFEIKI